MFCEYKDILGKAGEGFHRIRILDTAAGDYFGTILLSIIFAKFTKIPLVISTIFMFVLGILGHWLFCVPTGAVKFLGLA